MPQQYQFQELFIEQLNDLFSAEEQIASALPRVISIVSSGDLREALTHYLQDVSKHNEHMSMVFQELNTQARGSVCKAIEDILEQLDNTAGRGGNSAVKDAAIIAIVQRLQHYKIAVYGTARTFARHLSQNKAMDLLQHALNGEGEADKKLTRLAEGGIFTTGINEEAIKEVSMVQ